MSYQVLARKYRPQTFGDVLGQEHITRTLKNALKEGRLHHAYLFTGVRGVGKTTVARILAKALNCEKAPAVEPCNQCKNCADITSGANMDVQEIDGASNNGVENVREIRERLNYLPSQGKYKIYIIDEVHMLSTAAFNALLKSLEEPPAHVIFIFATTEPQKIPVTILSRCQRYDFRRMSVPTLAGSLKQVAANEGVEIEPEALTAIAGEAEGSMRDAQSLFDQAVAFSGTKVTYQNLKEMLGFMDRSQLKRLLTSLVEKDAKSALSVVDEVFNQGGNLVRLSQEMLTWLRDMFVLSATKDQAFLKDVPNEDREFMGATSGRLDLTEWEQMFRICYRQAEELARSKYPHMIMEALCIELANIRPVSSVDALMEKVDRMIVGIPVRPEQSRRVEGCDVHASTGSARTETIVHQEMSVRPERVEGRDVHASTSSARTVANTDIPNPAARKAIDEIEWKKFLAWLRGQKPQASSILEHGIFVGGGNGVVNLQCSSGSLYSEMLGEEERRRQLEGYIEKYFGTKYVINFKMIDGERPATQRHEEKESVRERAKRVKEETLGHEIIKEAASIFEADIKEIKVHPSKE